MSRSAAAATDNARQGGGVAQRAERRIYYYVTAAYPRAPRTDRAASLAGARNRSKSEPLLGASDAMIAASNSRVLAAGATQKPTQPQSIQPGFCDAVCTMRTLSRRRLHARTARVVLLVTLPGTACTSYAESGMRYQSHPAAPISSVNRGLFRGRRIRRALICTLKRPLSTPSSRRTASACMVGMTCE
jgi:hypothetical protein